MSEPDYGAVLGDLWYFAFNSIIYAACRNALAFKEPVQYNFEKQMLGQYLIPLGKYIGATGAVVVVSICICTLLRPSGIAAIVVNALISGGITLIGILSAI